MTLLTAPAADYISARVRSSLGFEFFEWRHCFQDISLLSREAEVIEVPANTFAERKSLARNSPEKVAFD